MAHPPLPTLVMFPILVAVYRRLAGREEQAVAARFDRAWEDYARRTPRLIPRLGATTLPGATEPQRRDPRTPDRRPEPVDERAERTSAPRR